MEGFGRRHGVGASEPSPQAWGRSGSGPSKLWRDAIGRGVGKLPPIAEAKITIFCDFPPTPCINLAPKHDFEELEFNNAFDLVDFDPGNIHIEAFVINIRFPLDVPADSIQVQIGRAHV